MFGSKWRAKKREWAREAEQRAAQWDEYARQERAREREHRANLAAGSQDPAADRYLMQEAAQNRQLAERASKQARATAASYRKWWT